jgi:hypothetical protein
LLQQKCICKSSKLQLVFGSAKEREKKKKKEKKIQVYKAVIANKKKGS